MKFSDWTVTIAYAYAMVYSAMGGRVERSGLSASEGALEAEQGRAGPSRAEQDAFRGGILADGSSGLAPFRVSLFFEEMPLS